MANVDELKKGYEAFNNGDLDGATEIWSDDIKWEGSTDDRVPGGGKYEGKEDAAKALTNISENFESFTAPPDEFIESDDGDTVVVLGHTEGKTKSGNEVKVPFVHIWRFEDDKASRAQLLTDTAEVIKAIEDESGGDEDEDKDKSDDDNGDDKDEEESSGDDDKDEEEDDKDDDDNGDEDDDEDDK